MDNANIVRLLIPGGVGLRTIASHLCECRTATPVDNELLLNHYIQLSTMAGWHAFNEVWCQAWESTVEDVQAEICAGQHCLTRG